MSLLSPVTFEPCALRGPWLASILGWAVLAHGTQQEPQENAPLRAPAQDAGFEARLERALPAKPEGLCSGDFDGDGRLDLAATLVTPGALLTWRVTEQGLSHEFVSQPCGDFPLAPVALPPGSFGAEAPAQGIASVSRAARDLQVFSQAGRTLAFERTPRALAAGKIGTDTLIAVACDGRRLEVLRDGEETAEVWTLSGELPRCALVSAGLSAVLVGFQDSTAIDAYSTADGAPIGRVKLGGIPRAMAELDIDGDGEIELVVAGGDRELWILRAVAEPGPSVRLEPWEKANWTADAIPTALAVGDIDLDGRADLAVLNDFSLSLQVLSGLSRSGPERRPSYYAGQTPTGLAILDADGDGLADFAVANRDTEGLSLFRGDGAGGLRLGMTLQVGSFPHAIAVSRTQPNNAALRMVTLNAKANSISAVVFENGALRSLPDVACGSEPRAPRIAEFDGEPGLDVLLLTAGTRGNDLRMIHGDVQGRLTPAATLELHLGVSDLALVDVDAGSEGQDPRLEIAVCAPRAGVVLLMESTAARGELAALERAFRLEVPSTPRALATIELDGDSSTELACVLGAPGERVGIAWLDARRTASGELELAELGFTALVGAPVEAAACDLNGDGVDDLAVLATRASDSSVGMWFGLLRSPDSTLEFTVSAPIQTRLLPRGIVAGDADGDGRAEVFVAVQNSTLVEAWTSNMEPGAPRFSARAFHSMGVGRGPLDLCYSDVTGDGVLDLCIANAFSNDLSVLPGTRP